MTEFNTRIAAQRRILEIVNAREWHEELFSLASKAIERWLGKNKIDGTSELAALVREAGAKLFFLANKSQEQITEDYRLLSIELSELACRLKNAVQEYCQ
jgi:hypothetical protein